MLVINEFIVSILEVIFKNQFLKCAGDQKLRSIIKMLNHKKPLRSEMRQNTELKFH